MSKTIKTRIQNKHDIPENWAKATFIPLPGELIIYDDHYFDAEGNKVVVADMTRYKTGDGITPVNDLPFNTEPIESKMKITGTVTKALGGIAKDKTYNDADIAEVLSDLLFPYVPFTFNSISTSTSAGTKEYGTSVTISKVTPSFSAGSRVINLVKIGTTSGGDDLYSGTSATNGTAITLTNSKTYDGTAGGTIYCSLSDGTTNITKSAAVSYTYYNYTAVTTDVTIPTTASSAKNNGTSAEATITTTDNSYIWFLMPNQNKKTIQQYAMNQWNSMATTYEGTVNFTTSTGKQVTYHAYRSDKMMSASEKYRIN